MDNKKIFLEYAEVFRPYFSGKNTLEFLQKVTEKPGVVFSTSFGKEDQVLTDIIVKSKLAVRFFTLDTCRLFNETYSLHRRTNDYYKIHIETFFPDTKELEKLISEKGPDSFFDSVENRKECCQIRKVNPLKRALAGAAIWLTGVRKAQSPERAAMEMIEFDDFHNVIKIHPLLNWSDADIESYIEANRVPVNSLHDKGYPSIGCAPCTRAVLPGEDPRAGRWYWEASSKECGLHKHSLEKINNT